MILKILFVGICPEAYVPDALKPYDTSVDIGTNQSALSSVVMFNVTYSITYKSYLRTLDFQTEFISPTPEFLEASTVPFSEFVLVSTMGALQASHGLLIWYLVIDTNFFHIHWKHRLYKYTHCLLKCHKHFATLIYFIEYYLSSVDKNRM